jgi:hypothetical protein
VRASRLLYHYLKNWDDYRDLQAKKGPFRFALYSPNAPDTNIVAFAIVPDEKALPLSRFNQVNNDIYKRYSILAEHGNRTHSYLQKFFLSRTEFEHEKYPYELISGFLSDNGIVCDRPEYEEFGLTVLRATVMNPYLAAMRDHIGKDLLFDFVTDLESEALRVLDPEKAAAAPPTEWPTVEEGAGI